MHTCLQDANTLIISLSRHIKKRVLLFRLMKQLRLALISGVSLLLLHEEDAVSLYLIGCSEVQRSRLRVQKQRGRVVVQCRGNVRLPGLHILLLFISRSIFRVAFVVALRLIIQPGSLLMFVKRWLSCSLKRSPQQAITYHHGLQYGNDRSV